jgi:hypothetical protein
MTTVNPDETKIRSLLYYAVDLGTPEDLSATPGSKTLEEIADKTFGQLQLAAQGIDNMWQTLNAYLPMYGGKRISASDAQQCKTPGDIWNAIWKAAGDNPIRKLKG